MCCARRLTNLINAGAILLYYLVNRPLVLLLYITSLKTTHTPSYNLLHFIRDHYHHKSTFMLKYIFCYKKLWVLFITVMWTPFPSSESEIRIRNHDHHPASIYDCANTGLEEQRNGAHREMNSTNIFLLRTSVVFIGWWKIWTEIILYWGINIQL